MKKEENSSKTFDVVTVGAAVIDHYARFDAFEMKRDAKSPTGLDAHFPLGAKLNLEELFLQTGGGATNAAVTFANLGLKTGIISRVGDDVFGGIIRDELESKKISTAFLQTDTKAATGQSIILLSDIGYRTILVHRGASAEIDRKAVPWSKVKTKWFYITSLGGDLGLLSTILDRAEAIGASVFWNPGNSELKKGLRKLAPLIKRVDLFDVNRDEAAMLAEESPRHLKRIVDAIGNLPRIGVLISDGPKGAYLHTKCCTWQVPPLMGKRINTTGAGDALGSGFVSGFIKTCDLSIGMKIGALNALGVITTMGAKGGILEKWPVDRILKRIKIKSIRLRH